MRAPLSLIALALASLLSTPALAQDAPAGDAGEDAPTWEVGGSLAATSDYVWRGVSQTQGNPALQAEVTATHASGFYVGAWASNVDFTAAGDDDDGIDLEFDPYIGWSGAVGGNAELDVFLTRVSYPGHRDGFDYAYTELEGKLTFAEKFYVGAAYSPDIFNLGGHGLYMNAGVSLPLGETGFDVTAQVGHYNLNDAAGDSYNDYLLGIGRNFGPLRADLQYTDTSSYGEALSDALDDASQADGRVALMLTWEF